MAVAAATGLTLDAAKVSGTGPYRNALAETLAQIEFETPGTFRDLTNWGVFSRPAAQQTAIDLVQPALDRTFEAISRGLLPSQQGALIGRGLTVERISPVDPALNAVVFESRTSTVDPSLSATASGKRNLAKAGVALAGGWVGHHMVPFAEVRKLKIDTQVGMVVAGWSMNSPKNMIALLADTASYTAAKSWVYACS